MSWTWQKQRVWVPSPKISSGCPAKRALDEPRDDHAVLAALARPDGVEEADDHAVEPALGVVGEREELVHRLRVGIGPAPLRGRPVDAPRGLLERKLFAMVAVDLRGRGDEDALAELGAVLEHDLRPLQVRDERVHRLLDDQPHADGGRQVVDDVALVDELVDDRRREHRIDDEVEALVPAKVLDIRERAGGEVVEGVDLDVGLEQQIAQMGADEAGAAGDQRLRRHGRAYVPRLAAE